MGQLAEPMVKPFIGAVGVYRFYDAKDVLLYIGIGSSPEVRWAAHERVAEWWSQAVRKDVQWFHVYAAARRAEIQAIWDENPVHNLERIDPTNLPEVSDDPSADELPLATLKGNMTEVATRTRLLRQSFTVTSRGTPVAAVVPIELGRLVRRAGGADRAAEILAEHLGVEVEDEPA